MAQGKQWKKDEVVKVLKPYFKLGCSIPTACDYAGVARTTIQTWIEKDPTLRLKITGWQNEISAAARGVLSAAIITNKDPKSALEWLARKEKAEFSTRQETTGRDGAPLVVKFDNAFTPRTTDRRG